MRRIREREAKLRYIERMEVAQVELRANLDRIEDEFKEKVKTIRAEYEQQLSSRKWWELL